MAGAGHSWRQGTVSFIFLLVISLAKMLPFFRRERDWVLGEFKAGRSPILIATDVASRGLGTYFIFTSAIGRPWGGSRRRFRPFSCCLPFNGNYCRDQRNNSTPPTVLTFRSWDAFPDIGQAF